MALGVALGWLARPGLLPTPLRSLPLESGKLVNMWNCYDLSFEIYVHM